MSKQERCKWSVTNRFIKNHLTVCQFSSDGKTSCLYGFDKNSTEYLKGYLSKRLFESSETKEKK